MQLHLLRTLGTAVHGLRTRAAYTWDSHSTVPRPNRKWKKESAGQAMLLACACTKLGGRTLSTAQNTQSCFGLTPPLRQP
eukprot:scaffold297332_cov21-Tisochrysis_lutea.AAC.1